MNFIHHYRAEILQRCRICVEHVSQYFGSHDQHICFRVDIGIAGEKAYPILTKTFYKLLKLLIREGFNRRCVETFLSLSKCAEGGKFTYNCLSRASGSGDKDALAIFNGLAGFDLEFIETKIELLDKFNREWMLSALLCCGVALGRCCHSDHVSPASLTQSAETGAGPIRSPSAYAMASATSFTLFER